MMKRKWVRPRAEVQTFTPNEYVAACFLLPCSASESSKYGCGSSSNNLNGHWSSESYGSDCNNHNGSCRSASNNFFTVDANGKLTGMYEMNSQQGRLEASFESYIDKNSNGKPDAGDVIFWSTYSGSGDRRWNHWGIAQTADTSHPNRS